MNVDYETLWALQANTESGGVSYDKSGALITNPKSGAQGMMQVLPTTNRNPGYGVTPAADDSEEERIRVGRDYSRALIEHYGDVEKGLAAYNWGPGKLDKLLGKNPSDWKSHLPTETSEYIAKIGGGYNSTSSPKYIEQWSAVAKAPKFTKAMAQDAVVTQMDIASGAQPNSQFAERFPVAPTDESAMYPEDVAREQAALQGTNFTEAFYDSLTNNTVTAGIVRMTQAGDPDPDFSSVGDDQVRQMKQAGVYGIEELADYVTGARNSQDFAERLQLAQERKDFMQRMANTEGWAGASAVAGTLVGGMADPVAIVASVGAGAAVAAARNAAAVSRLALVSRAALGGAVENIAVDALIREQNNQRFSWGNLFEQGVTGAALGAVGGLFVHPETGTAPDGTIPTPESLPVLTAAARAAQEVVDRQTGHAWDFGTRDFTPREHVPDESLSTQIEDMYPGFDVGMSIEERRAERLNTLEKQRAMDRAEEARYLQENVSDPTNLAERRAAREAWRLSKSIDEDAAAVRREVRERADTEEGPAGPVPRASTVVEGNGVRSGWGLLADIEQNGADALERALAGRLRNMLRYDVPVHRMSVDAMRKFSPDVTDEVGGFYHTADNFVAINDKTNSNWIALHELAHAATVDNLRYGLANAESTLGRLSKDLEDLRLKAKRKWDKQQAKSNKGIEMSGDTLIEKAKNSTQLVDYYHTNAEEFIAGLFSGNQQFIDHLSGIKVKGDDLLTRVVEIVRKVLGLDAGETNAFLKALDLTEKISNPQRVYPQTPETLALLSVKARQSLPLSAREQRLKNALESVGENIDPNHAETARRGQEWLANRPEWMKKGETWAYSPGVVLSASQSRVTRIAGSVLFENSLGSGARRQSVSMNYEMLQRGYRDQFLMAVQPDLIAMMTPMEKARYSYFDGARSAVERISTQVAEERLRHRAAVGTGVKYQSTAPAPIQRMAKAMDDQIEKMTRDGLSVGNEYAENVRGSGWVGFMPQVWRWERFANANRSDPAAWNALRKNFTQQYVEMNVEPALRKLQAAGATPDEIDAMRTRLLEQVEHQVDTRLGESIRDPDSRTSMDTEKFETMAAQILDERFRGMAVSDTTISEFRKLLGEHVRDRSRTEFDLLREVDGVRLLDYVEHDVVSTINHSAHRFAGQNAMAKAGFKDYADFEALITLAQKDGATPEEVELLAFGGRAFGFRPMVAQDHPLLASLRNFVYAATMGKLGIANLADAAAMNTAVGVQGMFRALGYSFRRETELYKSLSNRAAGLLGQDYRIHAMTADVLPNGKALTGVGAGVLRVSQKAAQFTSWINGSNFVQKMLHKGFLPVMAEDLVNAIRGKEGGMTLRRLADGGLTQEDVARIRGQLETYEASRKEGDAFNWKDWDDQEAADTLIAAMHRITYQVFQRTLVGEAAAWRSESALGSLVGQFHTFGITSMEKQLGRNLAINDMNTYTALAVGMAWSSLLFYSRLQVNMLGMTDQQRKEYEKKNLTPARIANGTLTYFNMSGILADLGGMGEVVFGGNSYQGGSGPVAAFGYLGNISKAANSVGSLATGQSESTGKDVRNILRVVPGGNSIAGTYFSNLARE